MPTLPVAWFEWLQLNLPGGPFLRESAYAFPLLLAAHVIAMGVFAGLILMMDLRLAGVGHTATSAAEMQGRLFPWQMLGFAAAAATGFLLFYGKPLTYYGKGFFWTKLALMALAGANAAWIHVRMRRSDEGWDNRAARFAGAASIVLWAAVIVAGRLVAYEWWTTEHYPPFAE